MKILIEVVENPHINSRQITRKTDISKTSFLLIFLKTEFLPFHVELLQELYDDHHQRWLFFVSEPYNKLKDTIFIIMPLKIPSIHKPTRINLSQSLGWNYWEFCNWCLFFEDRLTANQYHQVLREDFVPLLSNPN